MKRYNICIWDEESVNGEWVKYDDVVKYIASLESITAELSSVECNCAEKSKELKRTMNIYEHDYIDWICPAHGYKRI